MIKIKNLTILFILLFIFGGFYPFEINAVLFGRLGYYLSSLLILVLFAMALIASKGKLKLPNTSFTIIIFICFIYFIVWGLFLDSVFISSNATYLLLSYILIISVLNLIDEDKVFKFFSYFIVFSGVMIVIGLIMFALGKLTVLSTFDKGEMIIYNYGFFFVKLFHGFESEYMRPNGYFDEPGSYAYMAMLMLLFNKLYLKKKWLEISLILLPILTMSIAHIVTVFVYIIFFYINKKNISNFIFVLTIIIGGYFAIQYFANENGMVDYINKRIILRAENLLTGEGGNSREDGFEMGPKLVMEYLLGCRPEYIMQKYPNYSAEVFYSIPIFYGFQGVLIYILPFLFAFFIITKRPKEEKWLMLKALAIWCISLMQRPFYIHMFYILTLYFLFYHNKKVVGSEPIKRRLR